ncbi:type II secretion system F family protein [Candidatus Micrarchaeota archaeon]|nr:type II secretion system F family protein [Candidatus Micrarchaeota archaeon]MBU1681394.1 type II secretion system F family protein [Candidatus Micrarchaeota archaeon]
MIDYFPKIPIRTKAEASIRNLGLDPEKYMGMAIISSAVTAFLILLVFGFVFSLFSFASVLGLFLVLPGIEMKKQAAEIEAGLPFFLRSLGMLLDFGMPFESAIKTAAKGQGRLQLEMETVGDEINSGMNLQEALASFAKKYKTLEIKRAVSQVCTSYEIGNMEIRRIGDEMLSVQKHKLREYAAKSTMIGLMLIICTAILPTFFLVYAVAGRFALGSEITNEQISLAMLVLFPVLSIFILMISKSIMPRSAFENKKRLDLAMFAPGGIFILGFLILPKFQIIALIIGVMVAGIFVFRDYKKEKKLEELEAGLPDALFSISAMPKSAKPEDIFKNIEYGGFGELSLEAGKTRKQLKMNISTEDAVRDLYKRNHSSMLNRAGIMLIEFFNTDSIGKISMLAEDIISAFQIKREQARLFSLQKYTLVFGAFLIPLILKVTLYLLDSMSQLMKGTGNAVEFAASIVPPYLIIYATIASIAISESEGKKSSAAIYLIVLSISSLAVFYFVDI